MSSVTEAAVPAKIVRQQNPDLDSVKALVEEEGGGNIVYDWLSLTFTATFEERNKDFYVPKWSYEKEPDGAKKAAMSWLMRQRQDADKK